MNWTHAVIVPANAALVSLDDAKRDLDVTFAEDNALIQSYLDAATSWVENHTGRFLAPTTVEVYADHFAFPLSLPFAPFQSLTYLKAAGTTLAPRVVGGEFLKLLPEEGTTWPRITQELGALVARYVVGYQVGTAPPVFTQAIKLVTSIFYDKPDGKELEAQWKAARDLLTGFRVRSL